MALLDRMRAAESGGNNYARNPRSSATGPDQFVDRTWLEVMKTRPDLTTGLSRDQILALRTDPDISRQMTEAYAKQNQGLLSAAGVPVNDGTTYLAHFAGPQGAIKVLQADPAAPVGGILGDRVVAANPFLANMTAGDLAAWASKKMGASAPVPQADMPQSASPQQAAPQAVMAQGAPQVAPQAAPQVTPQAPSSGLLSQEPPELADLASLLQPQFKAPKRGLLQFRAS